MSALLAALDAPHARPPRQFIRAPAVTLVRAGTVLPQQRLARIAARRSFVDMKRRFIDAVAGVGGSRGEWLRRQVRQTEETVDLWLLRGAIYSALGSDETHRRLRLDLHQALDSVFPDSGFTPLPAHPLG
jgi:hypothetical protein